tara:strand:+ start:468 stop:686 length:219 start_codon:yes stop_codon:yes gene_type:complete
MVRPESPRTKTDKILVERITEHYKNSRKTYGYRRIHEELYDEGLSVGETRVRRLMKLELPPKTDPFMQLCCD